MTPMTGLVAIVVLMLGIEGQAEPQSSRSSQEREALADLVSQVRTTLWRHDLGAWFPRCVDEVNGGFTASYGPDWTPHSQQSKGVVFQARMAWVAAEAADRFPDHAEEFQGYALHGLDYLATRLWDSEHGGFFWERSEAGDPLPDDSGEKHVYGIAFGIYAASNIARVTGDARALDLAQRSFRWLEEHAYDRKHGGYIEALTVEGHPMLTAEEGEEAARWDRIGTRYGFKSMNTHIHVLEAFTELYRAWPDPLVRKRLEEVFQIVRDRMVVEPGCLSQYYTLDYRAVPDLTSHGHNVETAYLLLEAAKALGMPDDSTTWRIARMLVDHALALGFDWERGGFYDKGPAFYPAEASAKIWWVQAEGLNALLLMHERYGHDTSQYWDAFILTWSFVQQYHLDMEHDGWWEEVSADGQVDEQLLEKGTNWKAAYHTARAMMGILSRLEAMKEQGSTGP